MSAQLTEQREASRAPEAGFSAQMNPMRRIVVDKLTLNFGAGKDQKQLEKGVQLIKMITGIEPVKTITSKRIPNWGLRPGLPVGAKVTLRGEQASEVCSRLLVARDNTLRRSNIDQMGNVSFGLKEYIDIPGVRYDPAIGVIGLEASLTLKRPGYRVRDRKLRKGHINVNHRVSQEDAIAFMQERFSIQVTEE